MELKVIKTEEEFDRAVDRAHELHEMNPAPDSPEDNELEVLVVLIDDYQQAHHSLPEADPIELIRFMMDQNNLKQKDLVPYIGFEGRVSEVLNYKHPLTLPMIRGLSEFLKIPIELLAKVYELKKPEAA